MNHPALQLDADDGWDLGPSTAERPTSPPELSITDADLDALRARLRSEIKEDLGDCLWLRKRIAESGRVGTLLLVALTLLSDDCPDEADEARQVIEQVVDLEMVRREPEELANG